MPDHFTIIEQSVSGKLIELSLAVRRVTAAYYQDLDRNHDTDLEKEMDFLFDTLDRMMR